MQPKLARLKPRLCLACALMFVATVPDGASAWTETIDREPVRPTFVRRFGVPVVTEVLGPEIGGRSYALASDGSSRPATSRRCLS
jgi:hypothetical protein